MLSTYDHLQIADGSHPPLWIAIVSGGTTRQGRRSDISATAAGGLQGLQALSLRRWPPLGAFIKLPALRVAYLGTADNVSRLLPIPLRRANEPVIRTRNRFAIPRPSHLASI